MGNLVATASGVPLIPLYFKIFASRCENRANKSQSDYGSFMILTQNINYHLQWWIDTLEHAKQNFESTALRNVGAVFRRIL